MKYHLKTYSRRVRCEDRGDLLETDVASAKVETINVNQNMVC